MVRNGLIFYFYSILSMLYFFSFRDALFRLSLTNLHLLEKSTWETPYDKTKLCLDKGQSEEKCHNFIKVLLKSNNRILACGTNSFSPICTWREVRYKYYRNIFLNTFQFHIHTYRERKSEIKRERNRETLLFFLLLFKTILFVLD